MGEYRGLDRSVIFITGRNQLPLDDIARQARAVLGSSGNPMGNDALENLPSDQVEYWLSKRNPHSPAAITIPALKLNVGVYFCLMIWFYCLLKTRIYVCFIKNYKN
jgi:hypothetical protein